MQRVCGLEDLAAMFDNSTALCSMCPAGRTLVTSALVSMWVKSVRATGSLASLKHLCKAYRLACHYGDTEAQVRVTHTHTHTHRRVRACLRSDDMYCLL